ncbi:UBX domain-containing protein 4 [Habropoda laboriosa]|uniref:UBX domain-containing protein 4 n=1 Tax=Habropoda laboriosa TaxID=597456 RepID=A0A0L7R437_9HYME|nr:UBX domain-containing protein 4 [Habropoda laboriosa]
MKWFEGSINEAVATSKSRKAVFVVFIEGKDDTSVEVAEAINATEVSSRLEQEDFVAIRLESGSETYRFFVQIYQLVPVPSIFFIGENGTPLEIVAGTTTAAELASKIDIVLSKAGKNKNASVNLINAEQIAAAASSATSSNIKATVDQKTDSTVKSNVEVPQTKLENENDKIIANNIKDEPSTSLKATELPKPVSGTMEVPTKELTTQEKMERAQQLIEVQRKQRVEEEEKKEREREIERRKIGRDVQKMRQTQQDLEMKQAFEERMREKAADAAAREKVLQQIAHDKLERKQRELAMQQQVQQQNTPEPVEQPQSSVSTTTLGRIQFRLPSGNPYIGQFKPTDTLRDLRNYVVENIDLPFRQFGPAIEKSAVPSTEDIGVIPRFIWSTFAIFTAVYYYIVGYFTGGRRNDTPIPPSTAVENKDAENKAGGSVPSTVSNVGSSSGLVRRYLGNRGSTTIKTEGNIHRLHSGGDDNDENNTWNGNSTQQM